MWVQLSYLGDRRHIDFGRHVIRLLFKCRMRFLKLPEVVDFIVNGQFFYISIKLQDLLGYLAIKHIIITERALQVSDVPLDLIFLKIKHFLRRLQSFLILPLVLEFFDGHLIDVVFMEFLRNGIENGSMIRLVLHILKVKDVAFQEFEVLLEVVDLFGCAVVRYLDEGLFEFLHVH